MQSAAAAAAAPARKSHTGDGTKNGAEPRWATPRTPDRPTFGGRLYRLAQIIGQPFMPWQSRVANVAGELDPDTGYPAYREVRVTVPRQSGKTTLILVVEVDRSNNWGPMQRTLYAAQDRNSSRSKWEEQAELLHNTSLRRAFTQRRANGNERMVWKTTGSTIGITASGETSGHGQTLDLGVIDEAFAQKDERLAQAFRPACSMWCSASARARAGCSPNTATSTSWC